MHQPNEARIIFWKNWGADIRIPYFFLLATTLIAAGLGAYHYLTRDNALIQWLTNVQLNVTDATLQEFTRMLVSFEIPVNGFLITEQFDASLPQVNFGAAYLYLALLAIVLVFYLAIASTFRRGVYLGAMLLLMFFLASFNVDLLGIFPGSNKYGLILSLTLLAGVSYAFQAFFPETRLVVRLLVIAAVMAGLGAFIFVRSANPAAVTALHLVNYATVGSLIASLLFIILVAYENLHALLWVNSQARNPANRFGLWQFALISLLYLLNLLLLYFRSIGVLRVDFIYVDAFVVLIFSSIVGLWGVRQREKHYARLFPFHPGGAYLYLILATLTFLNIGYAFATANDPLVAAYTQIIVYTHLAFGTLFFVYVLINFGRLINQKLKVYRVVYEPRQIPFYVVYLMGSLLLLALLLRADLYIINQTTAGYYNYLGDLYKASGNELLAERFYVEGSVYEHHNVKSNYSLAGIYREQGRPTNEANALKEALQKRPLEKVYARLANLYSGREDLFEQMYILKEGLDRFPESSQLLNNMALVYNRTNILDSVAYYYDLAQYHAPRDKVIQSNRLSFLLKHDLTEQAAPLADVESEHLPLRSNSILLRHLRKEPIPRQEVPVPAGEALRPEEFALFYHTHLHQITRTDTSVVRQINQYLSIPENNRYDEDLTLLKAAIQHYNGSPGEAKATLENLLALNEATAPYYRDVLGLWMLEQGLYPAAADYFDQAKNNGYLPAYLHHSYALALAKRQEEAIEETRKIFASDDPQRLEEAQYLFYLLRLDPQRALTASDSAKVQYLRLDRHRLPEPDMLALAQTIQAPDLEPNAALQQAYYYLEQDNLPAAQQAMNRVQAAEPADSTLLSQANLLQAEIWLRGKDYQSLRDLGERYFTRQDRKELLYYEAALAEASEQMEAAQAFYDRVTETLVYHEEAMLAAANFYSQKRKDEMRAYEALLTGIIYNRFSTELYKAYILKSLEVGFESFARNAMIDLQRLLSPAEYYIFNQQYEEKLEQSRLDDPEWQ